MKGQLRLDQAVRRIRVDAEAGLADAGEHLLEEARRIVPHEEGTLERSSGVDPAGDRVSVWFDQPYAVVQHEDLTLRHNQGRTGKYLEGPLHRERRTMLALIAARIRRRLR